MGTMSRLDRVAPVIFCLGSFILHKPERCGRLYCDSLPATESPPSHRTVVCSSVVHHGEVELQSFVAVWAVRHGVSSVVWLAIVPHMNTTINQKSYTVSL